MAINGKKGPFGIGLGTGIVMAISVTALVWNVRRDQTSDITATATRAATLDCRMNDAEEWERNTDLRMEPVIKGYQTHEANIARLPGIEAKVDSIDRKVANLEGKLSLFISLLEQDRRFRGKLKEEDR